MTVIGDTLIDLRFRLKETMDEWERDSKKVAEYSNSMRTLEKRATELRELIALLEAREKNGNGR